jgi:signal transduction histidine kinase
MSGGYFDYIQYRLIQLEDEIENILLHGDPKEKFTDDVKDSIMDLLPKLKEVRKRIHHLDYYLEDDYGIETYLERLKELDK